MKNKQHQFIRASDVAEYIFCARAWKLRLDGHNPTTGQGARDAGELWHRRHGKSVRRARFLKRFAFTCILVALVILSVILLRWFR